MVLIGAHTFAWSPSIQDQELEQLFAKLKTSQIDFIELASYDLVGLTVQKVKELSELYAIPVTLCSGLPNGWNLASKDAGNRQKAKDHVRHLLDFANECGATKVSGPIHGDLSAPPTSIPSDDATKRLVESYQDLRDAIQQSKCIYSIEPLNRYQSNLLNTLEQAERLCAEINLQNFGILVDLFHANIEQGSLYKDLESHRDYTTHIHISGANRGELGVCHLDWEQIIKWLNRFPSTMTASIETFDAENTITAQRTRTWRCLGKKPEAIVLDGAIWLKEKTGKSPPK
ncbi:MAG: hypothetical protein CL862_09415 [Cyanobium sp. NAT70]|nr:hypothetical protein [Cyanobium sp. NAT70]|tara:strand:- start:488 stop:1348 length:861 start_codon:yes stop_codon:yes gene_type:complete